MATTSLPLREAVACDLCGKDDPAPLVTKNSYRVVRCRGCGLVYVNPRPSPTGLVALYDKETFHHHQVTRAEDLAWREQALARLALIDRHRPERGALLDVGCSAGWFLGIAEQGGWRVCGIDVAAGAVAYSRSKGFDARVATLESHDLKPSSFDAVTMFDSIEHMPSPSAALRAVHDLLADDGIVAITTPNVDGLFPRFTYQLLGRTFGGWEHPGPPGHVYQFGRRTLGAALDRAGFTVVHEETEAIALDHTVGALEDVVLDVLKGKIRRPTADDARVDIPAPPARAAATTTSPARTRFLRRALRRTVRTAAWALVGAVAAPAPLIGRGDSLVVIARKR